MFALNSQLSSKETKIKGKMYETYAYIYYFSFPLYRLFPSDSFSSIFKDFLEHFL